MRYIMILAGSVLAISDFGSVRGDESSTHRILETGISLDHVHNYADRSTQNAISTFFQRQHWDLSTESTSQAVHLNYRILVDYANLDSEKGMPADSLQFEKVVAYYERSVGEVALSAGLMEVTWGENLLMPILDVVNHRNVFHHRGFYDPTAKVASLMVQAQWRGETFSLQAIGVPIPLAVPHPDEIQGFSVGETEDVEFGKHSEFGGRLGAFVLGVDSNIYYFRHGPRLPSYKFQAYSGDSDLLPNIAMGDTFGASLSYATFAWIFKLDVAHHTNYPAINIGTDFELSGLTQGIFGTSYTTETGKTLGFELHADLWEKHTAANTTGPWIENRAAQQNLYWYGLTGNASILGDKVQLFTLGLKGVQKDDHLFRLAALYNATDSSTIGIEYQTTHAQSNSPKLLLDDRKTISTRYTISF